MPHLPDNASTGVFDLELIHLDLRYEGYRLPHSGLEATLLASIAREGIREPLRGVICAQVPIVLDGFKRCRCARQLHLHVVPFASWGSDEVVGIFELLRAARPHSLSMLEEARFVNRLHAERGLTVSEIAEQLGRSQAWVSLRLGLLKELSPVVSEALFTGAFPVYSYLYTLRPLRRMKGVSGADLDQFVRALGGQKLSVRQIQGLAHGFFRGPEAFREQTVATTVFASCHDRFPDGPGADTEPPIARPEPVAVNRATAPA